MASKFPYRPEIDGLRAVAVVPVILFHAGFSLFSGGFVGVDVFFVISGYLITSIILRELEAGTFTFAGFYERRARRILPALFLVIFCCIPFAWMWMMPLELKGFAVSVASVVVFISNIIFWRQSGYFDTAAELKPLLHTWSLAVEEQFYILFPIALMLMWRFGRRASALCIATSAIASLLLCEYASRNHPSFNFYWAITRAWELMAGALCAFIALRSHQIRDNALSALGLMLIFVSIFWFDRSMRFPSVYALLPVGGACLIILFARGGGLIAKLLSAGPLVNVGLISYSAYLWHQPIFTFVRIRSLTEPTIWIMAGLALLVFPVAWLTWRYVEMPCRMGAKKSVIMRSRLVHVSIIMAIAFSVFGVAGHVSLGFPKRISDEKTKFLANFDNFLAEGGYGDQVKLSTSYKNECNFSHIKDLNLVRLFIPTECYKRDGEKKYSIFIWGDSHAQQLYYGIDRNLNNNIQVLQVATSSCNPRIEVSLVQSQACQRSNLFAIESIKAARPDVVLISQVGMWSINEIDKIWELMTVVGVRKLIVAGPSPRWNKGLPFLLASSGSIKPDRMVAGIKTPYVEYNNRLKAEFPRHKGRVVYFDVMAALCNIYGCLTYIGEDPVLGITSFDSGHLSPIASNLVAASGLADLINKSVIAP